ncbi:MAG: ATP-binding protein [Spirulina sp.]
MILNKFGSPLRSIDNWKISKKIGSGYAVAISIAIFGSAMGSGMGDYYQRRADRTLKGAEVQQEYLIRLENAVLNIRSHPLQLLRVIEDEIWFDYEIREFSSNIETLQELLIELDEFIEANPNNISVPAREFLALKQGYAETIEAERLVMESLWQRVNPLKIKSKDVSSSRLHAIETIASPQSHEIRLQFERLYEDLSRIKQAAQNQKEAAAIAQVNAHHLRLRIIIGSFAVAVVIAALLAWRTSRTIARPLEAVTDIAREVTKASNFDLRAPITTRDEVGILADSLNQLIAWVGEYTKRLEESQTTLEQRVRERTRELQDTLENLKSTQIQLIQTEKMSGLGQMVAGVAHEINNPVSFIHGNLTHLSKSVQDLFDFIDVLQQYIPPETPEVEEIMEEIDFEFLQSDLPNLLQSMRMGSDRIQEIVLSLRNFSRLDEATMKDVDLHEGIDTTLIILNNRLKLGVEVIKRYGDLPPVFCYPAQLNQVFMNLIVNALDAMEEAETQGKQIAILTEQISGDRVSIKIRDNGPGIPDRLKDKLFDPFFTTKPIGKGTGLGLSICYQIIEKHKGTIKVESQPGAGTEFAIVLPIEMTSRADEQ